MSAAGPKDVLNRMGRRTVVLAHPLGVALALVESALRFVAVAVVVVVPKVVVVLVLVFPAALEKLAELVLALALGETEGAGAAGESTAKVNCMRWMMCSGVCMLASWVRSFWTARWRMRSVQGLRLKSGAESSSMLLGTIPSPRLTVRPR